MVIEALVMPVHASEAAGDGASGPVREAVVESSFGLIHHVLVGDARVAMTTTEYALLEFILFIISDFQI